MGEILNGRRHALLVVLLLVGTTGCDDGASDDGDDTVAVGTEHVALPPGSVVAVVEASCDPAAVDGLGAQIAAEIEAAAPGSIGPIGASGPVVVDGPVFPLLGDA